MAELITAYEYDNIPDLNRVINEAQNDAFDFVVGPLVHPRFERQTLNGLPDRQLPLTRSDLDLEHQYNWAQSYVGKVSSWLNFDSNVELQRINARAVFKQEIAWASHLGLSSIILPTPDWNCSNYASTVSSTILNLHYMKIWVHVPLISRKEMMLRAQAEPGEEIALPIQDDSWEQWNKFRTLIGHPKTLGVVLEITADLPEDWVIDKWLAEPVVALVLPTNIFLTNPKGFPVLSKRHQAIVKRLFRNNPQVIIKGSIVHPKGQSVYQSYATWLWKQVPPLTDLEKYERPYWDYLQAPLQPLMDNLESQTYETFEKDPHKYQGYQDAVALCLATDPYIKSLGNQEVVLMVLGAGRGPLVFASMRAAKQVGTKLKLYALEKNPNAVNTLLNLKHNHPDWADVTVVSTDIRKGYDVKADIVVSELLGSFGDNELSPECLYGAQDILKAGGISIPQQYISYIAPLASAKLWNESRTVYEEDALKNFETAYVVKFHAMNELADAQACFEFIHPDYSNPIVCARHTKMNFKIKHSALLHGFAGYFDCKLYDSVHISIAPGHNFTEGMFSWFPLYFPIRTPTYLPADSNLEVDFFRLGNSKQVWYEWSFATNGVQSNLHNPNGRSWFIGL